MDKETTQRSIILATPEIKSKGSSRRNSTGRTTSIGSLAPSNSDEKLLPRYLRPSMESCHDLCKYGRKSPSESEGKHPFLCRFLANKIITVDEDKNGARYPNLGERWKRPVIELKTSSKLKFESFGTPNIKNKGISPVNKNGLLEKRTNILSSDQIILLTSPEDEVKRVKSPNVGGMKGSDIKLKTATKAKNSTKESKVIKRNYSSSINKINALQEPRTLEKNLASRFKRSVTSVKLKMIKQMEPPLVKKSIPVLNQNSSAKSVISFKKKTIALKPVSILTLLRGINGLRNRVTNNNQIRGTSKNGEKERVRKPSASTFHPQTPANGNSSTTSKEKVAKAENYSDDTKVSALCESENIELGSVLRKTEDFTSSPSNHNEEEIEDSTSLCESENTEFDPTQQKTENSESFPLEHNGDEIEESESEYNEASESVSEEEVTESKVGFSEGEDKRRHRRTDTTQTEAKFSAARKLRFRRGKIIDVQPEINVPRRLRFSRRGRVVSDNLNGNDEAEIIRFKRRESGILISNDHCSESQTVALRHQEMKGEKDSQGLFNHVIEQTATKLVETRKSKVKALVGAFETVISLQESKPTSSV